MASRHILTPTARSGSRDTPADHNARDLKLRFVARLVAEKPQSVLDVGAGDGLVIERLRRNGVAAFGLEPEYEPIHALVRSGQRGAVASADSLPFDDDTFDWVAMRHVAHHLADPVRAFAEANRVARRGVMVAEPWYDVSIPSQELGLAIDLWRKRQHERTGRVHRPNLTAGEILAAQPEGAFGRVRIESLLDLRPVAAAELEPKLNAEVVGLDREHADRVELIELRKRLRDEGATYNGSLMVVLRRAVAATGRGTRNESRWDVHRSRTP